MELNQLETFLAVAEERSFSRAAVRLHRTQPAVSQVIRKLEQSVGETLFDRAARGQHFPMLGSGRQACQVLDVEDVCDAIYLCLVMRAGLVNDTFNLGAADYTAVRDSFQAVLDSDGRDHGVGGAYGLAGTLQVACNASGQFRIGFVK